MLINVVMLSFALTSQPVEPRLFDSHEVINATLEAPFRQLGRERDEDEREDRVALIRYELDGVEYETPLRVRVRGNFRSASGNCSNPPLRLNFQSETADGGFWDGQDKLKLVLDCRSSSRYGQLIIKEYLTYRMLNVMTEESFQVRPFRMTYHDSDRERELRTSFAFVIEDDGDLADRLGLDKADEVEVRSSQLDPHQITTASLFSLLVGNTDIAFTGGPPGENCCHNAELLVRETEDELEYLSVPYDFDMSGIVDAPYAQVNETLSIRRVTQRQYRGFCRYNDLVPDEAARIVSLREEILALWSDQPDLQDRVRNQAIDFLESGFELLANAEELDEHITRFCR